MSFLEHTARHLSERNEAAPDVLHYRTVVSTASRDSYDMYTPIHFFSQRQPLVIMITECK